MKQYTPFTDDGFCQTKKQCEYKTYTQSPVPLT